MPAGDRTGPMGMGPVTGHRAGYCAGYNMPGYANAGPGRGFGAGRGRGWFGGGGRGRGWRHWYHATGLPGWARFRSAPAWGPWAAPPSQEQEAELLRTQAEWLQQQLDAVSQRVAELEKEE